MNLNKVMLIGRLTRDPEMRYTPSGSPVTSFSIATNRYGQSADGEKKEYTDYHNVVAWNIGNRKLAELSGQYLHKGRLVYSFSSRAASRSQPAKRRSARRWAPRRPQPRMLPATWTRMTFPSKEPHKVSHAAST